MPRLLFIALLTTLLVGCSRSQHLQVSASAIPFTRQLQMHKGEAYEFQLPDGKTMAVWCEQPEFGIMLGEQTTKSGLKTAWGERAFRRPESLMRHYLPIVLVLPLLTGCVAYPVIWPYSSERSVAVSGTLLDEHTRTPVSGADVF